MVTAKQAIINAIENKIYDDEVFNFSGTIEHGEDTYEIGLVMHGSFTKDYGGSDDYGNREVLDYLSKRECYVDTLIKYDEEGSVTTMADNGELAELATQIEEFYTF